MRADWYFDFISPFSYLQFLRLDEVRNRAELTLKPVLFAGLLNANGQKGPAEIPNKRLFTYRYVTWAAGDRGVPFRFPDRHPFNPIKALRLAVALDATPAAVGAIFHAVWGEGHRPDDAAGWRAIQDAAGVVDGDAMIADSAVKAALIANGEAALAAGLFGVPSFVAPGTVGSEVFWGDDAIGFFSDWLDDPSLLDDPEMKRLTDLPSSADRQ